MLVLACLCMCFIAMVVCAMGVCRLLDFNQLDGTIPSQIGGLANASSNMWVHDIFGCLYALLLSMALFDVQQAFE